MTGLLNYFFILLFLSSCISTPTSNRDIASVEEFDTDTILKLIEKDIADFKKFSGVSKYKIRQFPITDISALENHLELKDFLKEKEDQMELYFSITEGYRNDSNYDWSNDFKIQLGRKEKLDKEYFKKFNFSERKSIIAMCYSVDLRLGRVVNPGAFFSIACSENFFHAKQFTKKELESAIISFPAVPKGVKYLGEQAEMKISSKELVDKINIITYYLINDKKGFREVFFDLPQDVMNKFRFNNYSNDEETKVEPFDLILHQLTVNFNTNNGTIFHEISQPIDFISSKRLLKKALAQTLLVPNDKDIFAWKSPDVSVLKNRDNFLILCANGILQNSQSYDGSNYRTKDMTPLSRFYTQNERDILEKWELMFSLDKLLSNGFSDSKFRCGSQFYNVRYKVKKVEKIPEPDALKFPSEINVLMTVALTAEISKPQRILLRQYLTSLKDWSVLKNFERVETKSKFEELFVESHMYFPVSHAMDVNYFMVGTEKSNYIVLQKKFESGGDSKIVNFHVLLPDQGNVFTDAVHYDVNKLGEFYSLRRSKEMPSLFLMNLSCSSENTLTTWTQVFRQSVQNDKQQRSVKNFKDLPYILGANRYFNTDSISEISQHINYPLKTIELLATGNDVRSVVNFLSEPNDKSFLNSIKSIFGAPENKDNEEDEQRGFMPVYNLDRPELQEYGGFSIEVLNLQTKKRQVYN